MKSNRFVRLLLVVFSLVLSGSAQVLAVSRVRDQQSQAFQQKYMVELRQLSSEAASIHFAYPFYFSETLDIDEARQKQLPQGSVRFANLDGQIVLEITGNYYASYSTSVFTANMRARKTFQDVILPLLKIAVARADRTVPLDAYAFEIAHHVRRKVLKVDTEGPENLMLLLPRHAAELLVQAKDAEGQQAALLECSVFLNGEPLTLWLTGDEAPADVSNHYVGRFKPDSQPAQSLIPGKFEPGTLVSRNLVPEDELTRRIREHSKVPPDLSFERMEKLQTTYGSTVQKLTADLQETAHFVPYAPPAFIGFRDGAYLQLNINTDLERSENSSQYRLAALAFDTHISHLLRPVARYFHDNPQFEGIDFSTTVHPG
ncbi:MAG TPA: hypothetical protein VJ723_03160, partial [Candidatus Angelobacter sp.]|nr:hypothetical protein [Candidatus Angelobacter sp.]